MPGSAKGEGLWWRESGSAAGQVVVRKDFDASLTLQPGALPFADSKEEDVEELPRIAQKILDSQPFSGLIGAKLVEFSEGEAVLEIPTREELLQQNGFVHGGVISYAADNALTFAGGSALGPSVLTSEYKINYLKPARGEATPREGRGDPRQQAPGRVSLRSLRHRRGSVGDAVRGRPGHYLGCSDRGRLRFLGERRRRGVGYGG